MNIDKNIERVLCAAIWYKELNFLNNAYALHQPTNIDKGIVVCGWRHGSIIQFVLHLIGLRTIMKNDLNTTTGEYVQGFLTSKNRFVNREEAHKLFVEQGGKPDFEQLYSEDLY